MGEETGNKGGEGLPIFSEQLPAEVTSDPKSQELLKGLKDVPHLFKSYSELRASSEGMVRVPDKDTSDEDRQKFFTKIGKPEKAEGYEITPVKVGDNLEGSQEFITAFKNKAFALNLSKGQTEQLYGWFAEGVKEKYEAQLKADKEANEKAHKKLRDLWSMDYSKKMENAKKVILKYGPDDLKEEVKEAGLQNSPDLAVFISNIAEALGEDVLIAGTTSTEPVTEEEKEKERLKSKYPSMYVD